MKQKFSINWVASKQPRKQKKYLANAPLHIRRKLVSANLSKDLKKKHSRKSFPLRTGDMVKIMRGEFKKKTGKVDSVDLTKLKITIAGMSRIKKDGSKISVYFNPSNLQITELDLTDKKRLDSIKKEDKSKETKDNAPK
jgi:large subunit ribosomal protein L24